MTSVAPDPDIGPIGSWVHRQAERRPDRPALVFENRTLSYAAFAERIERLAAGLIQGLGLQPGDRIAYLGRNHPDLLTLLLAAARLGLMVVPLNWRLALPEHQAILRDAAPAALVVEEPFAEAAVALTDEDASLQLIALGEVAAFDSSASRWIGFETLLREGGDPVDAGPVDAGPVDAGKGADPLLIVYTSGTTGRAKGAVLTQDALRWNAANSLDMHRTTAEDRILSALPLFHVGGLNIQTLPAFAVGATVRLEARFDPAAALRLIKETRPTLTVLVPAMMRALIDHPNFAKCDLSSLRLIATGSSQVPTALIEAFHGRGVPVIQVYGTTETAPIAVYQRVEDASSTIGSAGRVAKHGEMRILDEDGAVVETGISGDIQIRGPQLMAGYWSDLPATEAAFDGDWFRTNDVGYIDERGSLWVEARRDDLIKSGSERIYPAEIEKIIREIDGVQDVVVIGKANPTFGEVPVLVVQPVAGASLDPDHLLQHLDGRIARYKWPKDVRIVDALPRSALGKVLRYRLRAEIGDD